MKLKPVAFIQTDCSNGNRTYVGVAKDRNVVFATEVYDCGHGAHIARERLKAAGFEPSSAEWAYKLIREYSRRELATV